MVPNGGYVKQLKETEVKYLAGMMDADGSMYFQFVPYNDKYNVRLLLKLQQSISIDRDGKFINSLSEICGGVQRIDLSSKNPDWADAYRWNITSISDLNMIVPRLTKHMVIKAKHWENLLLKYRSIFGKSVTEQEMIELKEFSELSRKDTGPIKAKIHPSWGWVAGYLDGDGCFHLRNRTKGKGKWTELIVKVTTHNDDMSGIELLSKAFGGIIKKNNYENTHTWSRNLGVKDRSFAVDFLKKVHFHSKLKKYKIETMLHYHSQRLSDKTSTEDAIV